MRDTAVCWVYPSNRFLIFYSCSRVYAKTPCIARQGIMLLSGVSPLSTPWCVFVYMYLHLYFCRHIQLYLYLCICICSWVCTSLHVYSLCIMALYKTSPPMSTPAAANMGTAAGFNTSFVYLLFLYLLFVFLNLYFYLHQRLLTWAIRVVSTPHLHSTNFRKLSVNSVPPIIAQVTHYSVATRLL